MTPALLRQPNLAAAHLIKEMAPIRHTLEVAINVTPSGPERNLLTEANIHLMEAESALSKLLGPNG